MACFSRPKDADSSASANRHQPLSPGVFVALQRPLLGHVCNSNIPLEHRLSDNDTEYRCSSI